MSGVRLDLLLLDCVGTLVKAKVEPHAKGIPLWDGGVRDIAAELLKDWGVTSEPVTIVQVARRVGILRPEEPDVIDVQPNRRKRGSHVRGKRHV